MNEITTVGVDLAKDSRLEQWIVALDRVGYRRALAVANKHARIIWAILDEGESYDPNAWQRVAVTAANPINRLSRRRNEKIDHEVRPSTVKTG